MKRMLWAMAVVGLAAAGAQADWGGFGPPAPQQGPPVQPAGEFSTPHTLMGLGHNQSGRAPDRYGLIPGLRKAFRIGGEGCESCSKPGIFSKGGLSGGCANGNCGPFQGHGGFGGHGGNGGYGGHGGGGYGYDQPQYPPINQGTLVYPNHQFIRSPRDFFMYEPGR
jgi:hypothetical protein